VRHLSLQPLPQLLLPPNFMCSEITGRGTAGHIARIVQEQCLQPGTDCKVLTLTEEWLQVLAF
jgi:hypothetical protein